MRPPSCPVRAMPGAARYAPLLLALALLPLARPVGALASADRAQEATKVSVALDWYPHANHAGLPAARPRGYFPAEGPAVELYTPADPPVGLKAGGAGEDPLGIS